MKTDIDLAKDVILAIDKRESTDKVRSLYNNYLNYLNTNSVDYDLKLFKLVDGKFRYYIDSKRN